MSACSHTPKQVDARWSDVRCLNCRSPFRVMKQGEKWADGYNSFLTPSVEEKARIARARLDAELETDPLEDTLKLHRVFQHARAHAKILELLSA